MKISEVPNDRQSTSDEDLAVEAAVLDRVLVTHPARATIAELIREIAGGEPDFGDGDAVRRAVRDLSGVGLVHVHAELVEPTRGALRFRELQDR